jgi:hypothetical protein
MIIFPQLLPLNDRTYLIILKIETNVKTINYFFKNIFYIEMLLSFVIKANIRANNSIGFIEFFISYSYFKNINFLASLLLFEERL